MFWKSNSRNLFFANILQLFRFICIIYIKFNHRSFSFAGGDVSCLTAKKKNLVENAYDRQPAEADQNYAAQRNQKRI